MKDSRIDWVKQIPAHWKIHPVYSYFNERKNKNSLGKENNLLSLSYGRIIRKNINTTEGLLPKSFNTYHIVEAGDIIIRPTDLQNDKRSLRTGLVKEHGIITSAYIDLAPKKVLDSRYFHYLLHSYDISKVFYNMGNGVRQSLSFPEFSHLMMIEPPFEEQKQIADFLDHKCDEIDALHADIEKQIATLEEYKKSIITEAVTKGLNPGVEMKDSGIEWIGNIPTHWKISKLKHELLEPMKYGATETGVNYSDELPRYIRITDITADNKLKDDNKLSLTNEQAKGYLLTKETILFARSGATVGKTFFYKPTYGAAAFAGYLISAIPNPNKMLSEWLYYFTLSDAYWNWANSIFSQATIPNIGADKYSNLPIIIPSISEQTEIITYLENKCTFIEAILSEKHQQLDVLDNYKKSLIYEYVTGKKEVPSDWQPTSVNA